MLLERRLRPRVPCVAVAIIAVILSAVSLTIRADGARSSQLVDLPGPFPESVNTGPDIIHMQSVELSAEAQVVSRSDYWYQQSTGLYKEENRQAGEEVLSATAYTGDRLLGFDRVSGYAAEYTIGAYRSSFLATEFDPQRDYRNRASALAEEARLAIDSGQLIRETEELRDGRHTVLYRTADDQVKVTTWLVVDDMTGLPVEERVSRSSDASIITSRAYDYEVIPASSAPVGLFEMTLPPGITPRTDEDLPVDPAGLEVSAAEAARECAFNVFWLGDRYDGVPLQIVRVTPDRSAATVYYGNNYGSPQANSQGPRNIRIYEFSSAELLDDLVNGLQGAGARHEQVIVNGLTCELWTGGSIAPTLVMTCGATTLAIAGTPGEKDSEAEKNRVLRAAERLAEVEG